METILKITPAYTTDTDVVSLADAKANSKIEHDAEDVLLQGMLDGAVQDAENYTSKYIVERDAVVQVKNWAEFLDLPVQPMTTLTSIVYKNEAGNDITLPTEDYEILPVEGSIRFKMHPFPELQADNRFPITITGKVGYTEATLPKFIQRAILLEFSRKELYREDSPLKGNNRSFHAALRPWRRW